MAFFAAAACPFFLRMAIAFSMSAPASTSAARQSLKPALVRSRNSFTSCAGICVACCCVLIPFFLFALLRFLASRHCLQNGPPRAVRGGPRKFPTHPACLAFFLVRRNRCLRSFGQRLGAFHKVAFLLFVLLVSARIHVLHAFDQRLILRRFLIRHLRLLVSVVALEYGIRNLGSKQPDRAQRVVVPRNNPVHRSEEH